MQLCVWFICINLSICCDCSFSKPSSIWLQNSKHAVHLEAAVLPLWWKSNLSERFVYAAPSQTTQTLGWRWQFTACSKGRIWIKLSTSMTEEHDSHIKENHFSMSLTDQKVQILIIFKKEKQARVSVSGCPRVIKRNVLKLSEITWNR